MKSGFFATNPANLVIECRASSLKQGTFMQDPKFIREVMAKARLMYSEADLAKAFDKLASAVSEKLANKNIVVLTVMNGGLMTTSELVKRLNFPMQMDYLQASRYMGATSGGNVQWKKEPGTPLEGRVVLIVDDILDGGLTLSAVYDYCRVKGAAEVYSAVMLDKKVKREPGAIAKADFTGIEIADEFVFGFGLDYHEYLRNVPAIYAVASEHM